MLNEDEIKGKWKEIKGGLRNLWGELTEDELEQTKGNFTKISGLVQGKYGEAKEEIRQKFDRLMDSFDNETDKHPEDVGETSYMRNPSAEGNDANFSVGKDYDSGEIYEDRNARH